MEVQSLMASPITSRAWCPGSLENSQEIEVLSPLQGENQLSGRSSRPSSSRWLVYQGTWLKERAMGVGRKGSP